MWHRQFQEKANFPTQIIFFIIGLKAKKKGERKHEIFRETQGSFMHTEQQVIYIGLLFHVNIL